jgi:hypothetical protein
VRPTLFACVTVVAVAACSEPESDIVPAEVSWMEWPAEVMAAEPFTVRLVGYGAACREVLRFDPGTTTDNSGVTFEPFFLVSHRQALCPPFDRRVTPALTVPIIAPFFDTRASVGGLTPQTPRSYEIRGAADVSLRGTPDAALPVRMFGEVVVRSDSVDRSRTNAGGVVYAYRDSIGCVSIYTSVAQGEFILENPPADTASFWTAFVRGYIHKAAAPVCGESVVFHLLTRN